MPGSNGARYQVDCSGAIVRRLEQIQKQAKEEGRGEQVLDAIRHILHRLTHEAAEFGEPLYHLPTLHLQIRHAAKGPLVMHFAVHENQPHVFINGVALLPLKPS